MKPLILSLLALFSVQVFADLEFEITCGASRYGESNGGMREDIPVKHAQVVSYKLVKIPFKNEERKWDARYEFRIARKDGKDVVIRLEHGGSGDEGYNEYDVTAEDQNLADRYWFGDGTIDNDFSGASFQGYNAEFDTGDKYGLSGTVNFNCGEHNRI